MNAPAPDTTARETGKPFPGVSFAYSEESHERVRRAFLVLDLLAMLEDSTEVLPSNVAAVAWYAADDLRQVLGEAVAVGAAAVPANPEMQA